MGDLKAALAEAQQWVGTVVGVVMVGEGRSEDGSPTVDVWVTRPVALPQSLHGIEIRTLGSDPIEAH